MIDRDELTRLVAHGCGPEVSYPDRETVPALFARQVASHPTRTAVVAGSSRLTYAEIDRRATHLASRLAAAGVTPGARVAICLPRGSDQIVAVFAVLVAGGTFVPLDRAQPADRLAWMLADANVSAIITSADAATDVPAASTAPRVYVDQPDWHVESRRPSAAIDPTQAAYVIYTSGSTGRPKGVVVSHRSLVHSSDARRTYYRRPVGTFLLVSTLAFDSAMAGLFWTLCYGGTLVLPADDEHADPAALRRLIDTNGVTHALCLPSLYGWMLDGDTGPLRSLEVVIVAGEACPRALTERHHRTVPNVELHNEYGPTECAVWSTAHEIMPADTTDRVSIGRPIARARVYVTSQPWELAPAGASGEALIGGDGVADGYVNRPDLTAERFVPDAWSGRPGARAYRTGDRMQWLADGSLDFLGRVDRQVKLRGYRIELEEIEAAIAAHPDVRECAVVLRTSPDAIEAYIAPRPDLGGDEGLAERVRSFVAARVPGYMVPADLIVAAALPKNQNGKIDRSALPGLRQKREQPAAPGDAPVTPTEITIAALWRELLTREHIGLHDNFFDLGGHSLLAIEVYHRLHSTVAPHLRLIDLFEHPTVHALATFIAGQADAHTALTAMPDAAGVRARRQALGNRRRAARAS